MKNTIFPLVLFSALFLVVACEKDKDNTPDNEQELITTVRLTFSNGASTLVFNARDIDGDGGLAPVIDKVQLAANTTYHLEVAFLDESKTPLSDLTDEVRGEGTDHLVCFTASGVVPDPTGLDKDSNSKTLGLTSQITTAAAGSGTLQIVLKHLADKTAASPCSTGETDVETTFAVMVAN